MLRKFNSVLALFAFAIMVVGASTAMAQIDRSQQIRSSRDEVSPRVPTLGCCKCLGGTNALDLSTTSSNNWTVNGNPVVFQTQINSAWNINPGPAQWVSTSASAGNGSAGNFDYKLSFYVPECTIQQGLTLSGNYGADNTVSVYLDNTTNLVSACSGIWCFSSAKQPLPTFTKSITPGLHTLIVRVNNAGGPSGMFINARLTGDCAK